MHKSVLLKEVVSGLDIKEGNTLVDGTAGGGGVSEEIGKQFGEKVKIILIDLDQSTLRRAGEKVERIGVKPLRIEGNFKNIRSLLKSNGVQKVDRIIFDLGLSSDQLEPEEGSPGRGFSFKRNDPLLMTFSEKPTEEETTAYDIVNNWEKENIETIIRAYGEDRRARKIAEAIVSRREEGPIKTSLELGELIEKAIGRSGKTHPATKTFQALRIAVNDEIKTLETGLREGFEALNNDGRMAVISFHSLEDRVVKNFIKEKVKEKKGIAITKKPIVPSQAEMKSNPRSRSSKLRIIEKIND